MFSKPTISVIAFGMTSDEKTSPDRHKRSLNRAHFYSVRGSHHLNHSDRAFFGVLKILTYSLVYSQTR